MAIFVVIQIALFSLAIAQEPFGENNFPNGWWFQITPVRYPPRPTSTPCLLRSQPVVRRDDYTYTPGIGGHKVHTQAVTWNEARLTCEEEGGHLAIINSVAEANVIAELFNNSEAITGSPHPDFVTLGFHDLYSVGQFVTIHGQSLARAGFDLWADGQPDSGGAENCGSLHKNGRLNDVDCAVNFAFVCEIPMY